MSHSLYLTIANEVSSKIGVQLGTQQLNLIQTRIQKRIRSLYLNSIVEYNEYYQKNKDLEFEELISVLTTHHTFFFREFIHFEFLKKNLPRYVNEIKKQGRKTLKVWSAASSYGQEIYSLAIFLKIHLRKIAPSFDFQILGTDIDSKSIAFAKKGIYKWDEVKEIPHIYLTKNFAKGTGSAENFVKVKDVVKSHCDFQVSNLLEANSNLINQKFDVIFCRNVFIYFNQEQIHRATGLLLNHLQPFGNLILGVSESLAGIDLPIKHLGSAIYSPVPPKAPSSIELKFSISQSSPASVPLTINGTSSSNEFRFPISHPEVTKRDIPIRVLVVDDSSTVQKLLCTILEADGFKVVGIANNGREAEKLKASCEFDVMTLDIHMPQLNGLEYLRKNFDEHHPPVVIVSSVSRENAELAMACLIAGACDYVEKPQVQNLMEKTDEIRTKLKVAVNEHALGLSEKEFDEQIAFAPIIPKCNDKLRLIFGGLSDLAKFTEIGRALKAPQPPTIFVVQNLGDLCQSFTDTLDNNMILKVNLIEDSETLLGEHQIYVIDARKTEWIKFWSTNKSVITIALSGIENSVVDFLKSSYGQHLLLEESHTARSHRWSELVAVSTDQLPLSSLGYESEKYFIALEKQSA